MSSVTLYPRISATTGGANMEMRSVLMQIQNGFYSSQVEAVRTARQLYGKDSKEYKGAKSSSPYFTGSGTFEKRKEAGLIKHSGFIVVDIDNVLDPGEAKSIICADPHTYACFVSIGGEGLAVVIPIDPDEHALAFEYVERYYIEHFGIHIDFLSDVSRPRYVSYDPDLYINENAHKFRPADFRPQQEIKPQNVPEYFTDEEQLEFARSITERRHTWSEGSRHKYMFSFACVCNRLGLSEHTVDSYARQNYPHWAKSPSNAITWVYSNNRSEAGTWKKEKYSSSPPNGNGVISALNGYTHERKEVVSTEGIDIADIISKYEASLSKPIPEPEAVISIEGGTLSTAGNLTVITGPSKTGKSGVIQAIMSGAISTPGSVVDTLGLTVRANKHRRAVIHIDTEQSEYNHFRSFENTVQRAGLKAKPDFFHSLLFRTVDTGLILAYTQAVVEHFNRLHGGVFLIVVDGVGDYVASVNDDQEGNGMIKEFEKLSMQYDCPLLTVLHFNPNTEKERGHLGSQLQRKAESIIKITKDPDTEVSTIGYKELRNAGGLPEIEFYYDTVKGYHVFKGVIIKSNKKIEKREKLKDIVNIAFMTNLDFTPKELREYLMDTESIGESAANKLIRDIKNEQLILKTRDGKFEKMNF